MSLAFVGCHLCGGEGCDDERALLCGAELEAGPLVEDGELAVLEQHRAQQVGVLHREHQLQRGAHPGREEVSHVDLELLRPHHLQRAVERQRVVTFQTTPPL